MTTCAWARRLVTHSFSRLLLLLAVGCATPAPLAPLEPGRPVAEEPTTATKTRGSSRPASAAELAVVQTLMAETEALRGLAFLAPVQVTIEDRLAMRAYVERAIDDAQLRRATRRYLALGALDPAIDVRALLVSVMDEELIGYYDPLEKRLSVRADIARALGSEDHVEASSEQSLGWRATVVHELVHALQDQHFALGDIIKQRRTTDADNAFGALVEGDATLVMLGYMAKESGGSLSAVAAHPEQILSAMTRAPEQLTGALRRAPALLREPLLFRYREGAHFCAQLFRAGGWARVDAAQRIPPTSTLSIRDARRYLRDEAEPALVIPSLERLTAAGFVRVDEDVLGGLELSVLLEPAGVDAHAVVSAWRGDRYAVLEHDGQLASMWWLRFASKRSAKRIVSALNRLGDATRRVVQRGTNVLVARGLDERAFADEARLFLHASNDTAATVRSAKAAASMRERGDRLATAMHRH